MDLKLLFNCDYLKNNDTIINMKISMLILFDNVKMDVPLPIEEWFYPLDLMLDIFIKNL